MRSVRTLGRPRLSSAATLFLLAAFLAGCGGEEQEADAQAPAAAPPPSEVTLETVARQNLPLTFEYAGRVAGFSEVQVRARVGGILLERTYDEGDRVEAGDILFRIDPRPYQVAVAQAEAGILQARATAQQAEGDYNRAQELFSRNVGSEAQRDQALAQLELAQAGIAAAGAQLEAAQLNLSYATVTAPIGGITSLEVPPTGSLVATAGEESLLTTITQLDPAYVNFAFTGDELSMLQNAEEQGVTLPAEDEFAVQLLLGGERPYSEEGRVDFADQTVNPETGTIRARAIFENGDGILLPGMFVRVVVNGISLQDAVLIPAASLSQGPQGPFVYVVTEGDVAEVRPIRIGRQVADGWVVTEGLENGDRLIVGGLIGVRPGAPVRVLEAAPAEAAAPAGEATPEAAETPAAEPAGEGGADGQAGGDAPQPDAAAPAAPQAAPDAGSETEAPSEAAPAEGGTGQTVPQQRPEGSDAAPEGAGETP